MNNRLFFLTSIPRPNSFHPINWTNNPMQLFSIEEIDKFTSKYTEESFRDLLVEYNLIINRDDAISIAYANNKKFNTIKTGVIFNDSLSFKDKIIEFFTSFRSEAQLLNDFKQKVFNDKFISEESKNNINYIISNRKNNTYLDDISLINSINNYLDLRNIYFYTKQQSLNIEHKNNYKLEKTNH